MRRLFVPTLLLVAATARAEAPAFSKEETAAIYRAAGFTVQGDNVSGCDAADPAWPRSSFFVEAVDLSGDGRPEAIVSEGNVACYGRDEQGFTILAKRPDGKWHKLATGAGVTRVLKTRTQGWLEVEYGGPGMQEQPVLRWDGAAYR